MTKEKEIKFEQPSEVLILMNRYVMVMIAIIVIGILSLGYFLLLAPKIENIKEIEAKTSDIEDRRILNENLLNKIKELEKQYDDLIDDREGQLAHLMKVIPEDPQLAELFVLTERLAKQRGFELRAISISESDDNAVNPLDSSDDTGDYQASASLKSIGVNISLSYGSGVLEEGEEESEDAKEPEETPYQVFKQYLVDLENNLRLMDIQSVSFGSLDPDTGSPLIFNFDIITYYK